MEEAAAGHAAVDEAIETSRGGVHEQHCGYECEYLKVQLCGSQKHRTVYTGRHTGERNKQIDKVRDKER
jgi:hypothetical protein